MAKAPRLGHGKSRLATAIGRVQAHRINRFLHRTTLRAAIDPRWETVLAVSPDAALTAALPGLWPAPGNVRRIPQGRGDLGARLSRRFSRERRPVAVIGADVPELTPAHIWAGFTALRRRAFAIGPAVDGGFWLFAARHPRRAAHAFEGVRWSSPHARADLLARLSAPAAVIATLPDIDTLADWRAFQTGKRSRRGVAGL